MKKSFFLLFLFVMLTSCASSHSPEEKDVVTKDHLQGYSTDTSNYINDFSDFAPANLPQISLSPNDLAILLKADIAYNQEAYALARDSYYALAKKYNDPRLIYKAIICYEHTNNNLNPNDNEKLDSLLYQLSVTAPHSNASYLFAIKANLEQDNLAIAKHNLEHALQNPQKIRAGLLLLTMMISNQITPSAESNLLAFTKFVTQQYHDFPQASLFASAVYAKTSQQDQLLKTLTTINKKYPSWDIPLLYVAKILTQNDNRTLLYNTMQYEIDNITTPSEDVVNLYIASLIQINHLYLAKAYVESAIKFNPNNPSLKLSFGIINYKLNKFNTTITILQQVLKNNYNLAGTVNLALANLYAYTNQSPGRIIHEYESAAIINPSLVTTAKIGMIQTYLKSGNIIAANQLITTMNSKLKPREKILFSIILYSELGDTKNAYHIINQYIQNYKNDPAFVYYYASLSALTNHTNQAIKWYHKYIKINPSDAAGYNDLGFILADKTNEYQEAHRLAIKAYQMSPQDGAILDTLGWTYYKLTDYKNAEKYLLMANNTIQDHDASHHLQELYLKLGRHDLAQKVLVVPQITDSKPWIKNMLDQSMLLMIYAQFGQLFISHLGE